jgi:hypothetical protein
MRLFLRALFLFYVMYLMPGHQAVLQAQEREAEILAMHDSQVSLHVYEMEDSSRVELAINQAVPERYEYFVLSSPGRFVLDFEERHLTFPVKVHTLNTETLHTIRIGQHPKKTRIVLQFRSSSSPRLEVRGSGQQVVFRLHSENLGFKRSASSNMGRAVIPRVLRARTLLSDSRVPIVRSFSRIIGDRVRSLEDQFRIQDRHLVRAPGIGPKVENPEVKILKDTLLQAQRSEPPFFVEPERIVVRAYETKRFTLTNPESDKLRVTARIVEILDAGTREEHFVETQDVSVLPGEFTLKANGRERLKVWVLASAPRSERVFELQMVPLNGGHVSKGLGAPIFVPPQERQSQIVWERDAEVIALENLGNVSALIDQAEYCDSTRKDCRSLSPFRLYPGNKIGIALPEKYSVSFQTVIYEKVSTQKIAAGEGQGVLH